MTSSLIYKFEEYKPQSKSIYDKPERILDSSIANVCKFEIARKQNQKYTSYTINRRVIDLSPVSENIKNEIEILGSVCHPYIQKFVDTVVIDEKLCLILDYEEKQYLSLFLDQVTVDEEVLRDYFLQLMEAVQYLHKNNIVHLDIRPDSLYIDSQGNLKLSKFFNAKRVKSDGKVKGNYGNLNYQAPEIFDSDKFDGKKADIWACGTLLLSSFTYRNIFSGNDYESVMKSVKNFKNFKYPPLSDDAIEMLKLIMDPNPETRASADEVLQCNWLKKKEVF